MLPPQATKQIGALGGRKRKQGPHDPPRILEDVPALSHLLALALPGTIGFGRVRFPVYGLFATAGLIAALLLTQRTAPRSGVTTQGAWDAGIFAITAAFVASRLLLILGNMQTFRAMPMMVLTLPSLTYPGLLLTAVFTWFYLLLKRVPVLATLDAWSAPAALLAAFLELGHFFEGTDAGMPTRLPWGVHTPGDMTFARVQPVQLYGVLVALALMVWFYRRLPYRRFAGEVAAIALFAGGACAFLLDMLRQPFDSYSKLPLDASQIAWLVAMLAGIALFTIRTPVRKSLEQP